MARKKNSPPHEEHVSEAWLLPYSDMLTLLFALFLCLFCMGEIAKSKVNEMGGAFNAAFTGGWGLGGGGGIFSGIGPYMFSGFGGGPGSGNAAEDRGVDPYFTENQALTNMQRQMDNYIRDNRLATNLNTTLTEEGLMIRIKEKALFPSGSAELVPESQLVGPVVAGLLAAIPERVIISGHTDIAPINTPEFPSNWELSTTRAVRFMKFLLASNSTLDPARFSVIGYGEFRPVADNSTEEGRAQNRRVEIMIARSFKMAEGTLVAK